MKTVNQLTVVTPLARLLAIILFVILPVWGFVFGVAYEQNTDAEIKSLSAPQIIRVPMDETTQSINTRCGTIPENLSIYKTGSLLDSYAWSPDCRYISWSVFHPTVPNPNVKENEADGVYLYSDKTGQIKRIVMSDSSSIVRFERWLTAKTLLYIKDDRTTPTAGRKSFIYNVETGQTSTL
jgi:hypothetical protein